MQELISVPNVKMESVEHWSGGEQYIVTCSNGYGASIINLPENKYCTHNHSKEN